MSKGPPQRVAGPFPGPSTSSGPWHVQNRESVKRLCASHGEERTIPVMKTALIVQGGWDGHEPRQVAELLASALRSNAFRVTVADSLDAFLELDPARPVDLSGPVFEKQVVASVRINRALDIKLKSLILAQSER